MFTGFEEKNGGARRKKKGQGGRCRAVWALSCRIDKIYMYFLPPLREKVHADDIREPSGFWQDRGRGLRIDYYGIDHGSKMKKKLDIPSLLMATLIPKPAS